MTNFTFLYSIIMKYIFILILFLSGCSNLPKAENIYINIDNSYIKLSNDFYTYNSKELLSAQGIKDVDPDAVKVIGFVNKTDNINFVLNSSNNLMGLLSKNIINKDVPKENDINVIYSNLSELLKTGDAKIVDKIINETTDNQIVQRVVLDIFDSNNQPLRILQKTITDIKRENIYVLILGCNPQCFSENDKVISQIENTWKVELNE
jgi:hypothetical protein